MAKSYEHPNPYGPATSDLGPEVGPAFARLVAGERGKPPHGERGQLGSAGRLQPVGSRRDTKSPAGGTSGGGVQGDNVDRGTGKGARPENIVGTNGGIRDLERARIEYRASVEDKVRTGLIGESVHYVSVTVSLLLLVAVGWALVIGRPAAMDEARDAGHAAGFSAALQHANVEPMKITELYLTDTVFRAGSRTEATIIYDRAPDCEARYIPTVFQGKQMYYLQPAQIADDDPSGTGQAVVVKVTFQTGPGLFLTPDSYELAIMAKIKCPGLEEKTVWSPRKPIAIGSV